MMECRCRRGEVELRCVERNSFPFVETPDEAKPAQDLRRTCTTTCHLSLSFAEGFHFIPKGREDQLRRDCSNEDFKRQSEVMLCKDDNPDISPADERPPE